MRPRTKTAIEELRQVIDCLPRRTRIAMLQGIESNRIIAGAYTSDDGGVCPMLAAHRAGGRTDCIAFAKAWDRFAFRGSRSRRARRATPRELLVLKVHLEASLLEEAAPAPELARAIADHQALRERHAQPASGEGGSTAARRPRDRGEASDNEHPAPRRQRPGDPDRSRELRTRPGWAWTRLFRRLDDYERALELLEEEVRARGPAGTPVP